MIIMMMLMAMIVMMMMMIVVVVVDQPVASLMSLSSLLLSLYNISQMISCLDLFPGHIGALSVLSLCHLHQGNHLSIYLFYLMSVLM